MLGRRNRRCGGYRERLQGLVGRTGETEFPLSTQSPVSRQWTEEPGPFPQPLNQLGSLTNPGVTPVQRRDPVPPPTTSPLPSPPAETILNAQRCVFRAQEPQGAFISEDIGKQARGSGCRYRSVHTNNDTLIHRRHTCSKQPPSSRLV